METFIGLYEKFCPVLESQQCLIAKLTASSLRVYVPTRKSILSAFVSGLR